MINKMRTVSAREILFFLLFTLFYCLVLRRKISRQREVFRNENGSAYGAGRVFVPRREQ